MAKQTYIINLFTLFVALLTTWYIFSGFSNIFFLTLGTISCLLAIYISHRMKIISKNHYPLYTKWRALFYFVWLFKEMLLSSFAVSLKVWQPKIAISPMLGWVKNTQHYDENKALYANSITLTPGTVCTEVSGDYLQVHALNSNGLSALKQGKMDRLVTESVELC